MRITKFKIVSQNPEEVEFILTRKTKMTTTSCVSQEVDDVGNVISPRHPFPVTPPTNEISEELEAISLPTRTPAKVIILETDQGPTEAGLEEMQVDTQRMRPVRIDTLMRQNVRKINPGTLF